MLIIIQTLIQLIMVRNQKIKWNEMKCRTVCVYCKRIQLLDLINWSRLKSYREFRSAYCHKPISAFLPLGTNGNVQKMDWKIYYCNLLYYKPVHLLTQIWQQKTRTIHLMDQAVQRVSWREGPERNSRVSKNDMFHEAESRGDANSHGPELQHCFVTGPWTFLHIRPWYWPTRRNIIK